LGESRNRIHVLCRKQVPCVLLFPLFVISAVITPINGTHAYEVREIELTRDPAFLRFTADDISRRFYKNRASRARVFECLTQDSGEAIVAVSVIPDLDSGSPATLYLLDLQSQQIVDAHPRFGFIHDFCVVETRIPPERVIIQVVLQRDSLFAIKTRPFGKDIDTLLIAVGQDRTGDGKWQGAGEILMYGDVFGSGRPVVVVATNANRDLLPRDVVCIDVTSFQVVWKLSVASPVRHASVAIHNGDRCLLLASAGVSNGVTDSGFTDRFGYFTAVSANGKILWSRMAASEYKVALQAVAPYDSSTAVVYHTMPLAIHDEHHTPSVIAPTLSLFDVDGLEIRRSVSVAGEVRSLWFAGEGKHDYLLYALCSTGAVKVFDTALVLQWESTPIPLFTYIGSVSLEGEDGPAMVFDAQDATVVFTQDMTQIAYVPVASPKYFDVVSTDARGNAQWLTTSTNFQFGLWRRTIWGYILCRFSVIRTSWA